MDRLGFAIALALIIGGCSAPQINNNRLGSVDLVTMTDQMAASLLKSSAVASRDAASPPWIVTMNKISNQTNDILPEGEKWAFMSRLRAQLAESPALTQRNFRFIVPAEKAAGIHARDADALPGRALPTHALTATFHALTSAAREGLADTYLFAFQLLNLADDTIVWEDKYEVKRVIVRNQFD